MKRKVTRARVHDMQIVIPGIGQLEKELPPQNKTLQLDMYIDSDFPTLLFVKVRGMEVTIPLANVQIAFLAPEEAPKPAQEAAKPKVTPKVA